MTPTRALSIGLVLSFAVHLGALVSPGWSGAGEDMPTDATRLMAEVRSASADKAAAEISSQLGQAADQRPPAPALPDAANTAMLPPQPEQSAPQETTSSESAPVASASVPALVALEPKPQEAPVEEPLVAASAPSEPKAAAGLTGNAGGEKPSASSRLPKSGRVRYVGSASILAGEGEVFWTHDGARLSSRLAAGLRGQSPMFTYESVSSVGGALVVSKMTRDDRRGKVSESQIDLGTDLVTQQRGDQTRTKQISGAAVALSALPQFLATFDEELESAAIFIVGDFWVEDSVVVNRGMESVELESGRIEARHFQSRTKDGKEIDIWLAPAWRNAPVRIRIKAGASIDLKAVDVEIEGRQFATMAN